MAKWFARKHFVKTSVLSRHALPDFALVYATA